MSKQIFMIAGPNGAGKTTTAISLTSTSEAIHEFINADEIARGLAPLHPETISLTAGKLMLQRLHELLNAKRNFAFETTGSGLNYVKYLKEARTDGYQVTLIFLWLSSPELAIQRVAKRVAQGGHNIPSSIIVRRYYSGLKNLVKHYLPIADSALILDNSLADERRTIATKHLINGLKIEQPGIWKEIEEMAHAEKLQERHH